MKKTIFVILLSVLFITTISCRADFDFEAARQGVFHEKAEDYGKSFKSVYGEIASTQSWDFSTEAQAGTRAGEGTRAMTRAAGDVTYGNKSDVKTTDKTLASDGSSYDLPGSPTQGVHKLFEGSAYKNKYPDGADNSSLVKPATLVSTGEVVLCPVWHDKCMDGYKFVVDGLNPNTGEILRYEFTQQELVPNMNYVGVTTWNSNTYTDPGGQEVKPIGYIFPFPAGYIVSFYLSKDGNNGTTMWANNDTYQIGKTVKQQCPDVASSVYGQNVLHDKYNGVYFLDDPDNDKDFNDLVVLVVKSPLESKITPGEKKIYRSGPVKRYMVEDLGATGSSDIDFNDVVFDLEEGYLETWIYEYEYNTSTGKLEEKTPYEDTSKRQTFQFATLRAMGGTLDFQLKFNVNGTTTGSYFTKGSYHDASSTSPMFDIENMSNTGVVGRYSSGELVVEKSRIDWNKELAVIDLTNPTGTGCTSNPWDPTTNNIVIGVGELASSGAGAQQQVNNTNSWTITFPGNGEVPMMLAFDATKQWRAERQAITTAECIKHDEEKYWFTNVNTFQDVTNP